MEGNQDPLYADAVAKAIEICIDNQRPDRAAKVLEEAKSNGLPLDTVALMEEYITNMIVQIYVDIMVIEGGSRVTCLQDYEAVCTTAQKLVKGDVDSSLTKSDIEEEYYSMFEQEKVVVFFFYCLFFM